MTAWGPNGPHVSTDCLVRMNVKPWPVTCYKLFIVISLTSIKVLNMIRNWWNTTALAQHGCFIFIHQVAALFCVKWCHDHHLESPTSNRKRDSVDRCIFTWKTKHSCQISSRSNF